MVLSINERLHLLLNIPPAEGRLSAIRTVRKFREDLALSEEEMKVVSWKEEEGRVVWNPSLDPNKDIDMGDFVKELVVKTLSKLDEVGKLKEELLPLYDRLGLSSSDN